MDDRTEAEIRNAALEEAAQVCDKSSLQPAIAARIRALKSAPAAEESAKGADVAQPKRRPYNASASLSEYGVFPECDTAPAAQAPAKGVKLPLLPEAFMSTSEFPGGVYSSSEMQEYGRDCYEVGLSYSQQRGGDVDERAMFDQWFCQHSELPLDADTTQYDEAFLAYAAWKARAALAATKAGSTEKLLRFCPSCGMLGDLPPGSSYLACCPDHGDARMVPEKFARQCKQLFSDALAATKGESNG